MLARPKSEAEYAALACKLADTGEFASAEFVRVVLGYWSETSGWWTDDLADAIQRSCVRALGDAALPYRFVISAEVGKQTETLEVVCHRECDAVDAAKMFAEEAAYVELWQGDRRVFLKS